MTNNKESIHTDQAPAAIGPYSQAVKSTSLVFLSGQIPLNPQTMELVGTDIEDQAHQVFSNLSAVAEAAQSNLNNALKLTIYLCDLADFTAVNEVMMEYFREPYPARATVQINALPKGARIEIDAILSL